MTEFEIGQRVHATDTLVRKMRHSDPQNRDLRTWVYRADQYEGWQPSPTPIDGIVVGLRTLSDGHVVYDSYQTVFTPSSHRQAVLIADQLRRKPRLVWVDDVQDGPAGDPR